MFSTVTLSLEALSPSRQMLGTLLAYFTNLPETIPDTPMEPQA